MYQPAFTHLDADEPILSGSWPLVVTTEERHRRKPTYFDDVIRRLLEGWADANGATTNRIVSYAALTR